MEIKKDIDNIHDKSYKNLLSNKEVFINMISTFIEAKWAKNINVNDLVLIDKEYILSDYEEIESDIVYKVNNDEQEVYFYVLMELQSKVDYSMPIRLFMYIYGVYREIIKNTKKKIIKGKKFKLPAVIPIVLYNGKYKWTAERNFKNIIYNSEVFGENIINFEYILLDVNRYDKVELMNIGNISAAIFMLDQKISSEEYINRIREIAIGFNKLSENDINILKNWLRNTLSNEFKEKFKVEDILNSRNKEIDNMTSNIYKTLKEEYAAAESKGIEKGIERGIVKVITKQLNKKFNTLPENYEKKINELNEEQLEALVEDILDIESLNELDKYLN